MVVFLPFRFILLLNRGQKDSDSDIPNLFTLDPMEKLKKINLEFPPVMSVCLEYFYSFLSSVNTEEFEASLNSTKLLQIET